jgi:hypothetical protein
MDFTPSPTTKIQPSAVSPGYQPAPGPPPPRYWIIAQAVDSDAQRPVDRWFSMQGNPIRKGDRVVVWQLAWPGSPRAGMVGLGQVLTNRVGPLARVCVRCAPAPQLPIWVDQSTASPTVHRLASRQRLTMAARAGSSLVVKLASPEGQSLVAEAGGWPAFAFAGSEPVDTECFACGRVITRGRRAVTEGGHLFHKQCATQLHHVVPGGLPSLGRR